MIRVLFAKLIFRKLANIFSILRKNSIIYVNICSATFPYYDNYGVQILRHWSPL
jgi:hypothetical protein